MVTARIGIRKMKIRYMLVGMFAAGALAAPLHAQDTTAKKPGGLNKVAHDVSATTKKAGRDTKAEVHRDAAKGHDALQTAGNQTKTATGNVTGVHKVGGSVGDAAQAVSHAGKKTGTAIKSGVKKTTSSAHDSLSSMGKGVKAEVKKP
jgi:hypothetical protein